MENKKTNDLRFSLLILFVLFTLFLMSFASPSLAITVNWADKVTNSNIADAGDAIGKPDGVNAAFNNATGATAEYSEFQNGENINYSTVAFAELLGVSESLLEEVDVVSFEFNGSLNLGFETSDWIFDDGINSMTVSRVIGDSPSGSIVGAGSITKYDYESFFGAPISKVGEWVYLLFDIDGHSMVNPFSSSFSITLDTPGTGIGTPNPDAIGLIGTPSDTVPEPSSILLLTTGLLALIACFSCRKIKKSGLFK